MTTRDQLAAVLTACGVVAATAGGFVVSTATGLFVFGGLLVVLGVLFGLTSEPESGPV